MTAGEWAVSTDTKYVRMCFAPGIVIRMATYEAFEQDMLEIQTILATCQDIQQAVEAFESLAEQHALQAESWSTMSKSWAAGGTGEREGEDTNNSKYWSQQSKSEADRAKNEADRAASIAGIDIDSELSETSTNPVQNKVITKALNEVSVDISNESVSFTEASARSNIQSGEKFPVLFGKIKKWYSDFKTVAFSGSYTDLSNKPTIPPAVAVKGNAESVYRTGNVNLTPDNIGAIATSKVVESTNITQPGFLMDGKTASEAFSSLNSNSISEPLENVHIEQRAGIAYVSCSGSITVSALKNVQFPIPLVGGKRFNISTYVHTDSARLSGIGTLDVNGKMVNLYYHAADGGGTNACANDGKLQFAAFSYIITS